MECSLCGISGERVGLFDVISDEGIVKVCERCAIAEELPILRKPEKFEFKEIEKKESVYERMSRVAGVRQSKSEIKPVQNENLREIVEKNYKKQAKIENPADLVDNFHWVIMRARRARKLAQKELAENIGEPEIAIKSAEKGILPKNYERFIIKIENGLGINLFKKGHKPESPQEVVFDRKNQQYVTVGEIKEETRNRDEEITSTINEGELEYEDIIGGEEFAEPKNKGFFSRMFGDD